MYDVIHVITGLADGGAEAMLYRLVARDSVNRHLVVSLMSMGKYGSMLQDAGVRVVCLEMPQGKLTANGVYALWRLLYEEKPRTVQTWMYHADLIGGVLARLAGVKRVVWGVHNATLVPGRSRFSTRIIAKVNALLSHWVPSAIVCCAERARDAHLFWDMSIERWLLFLMGMTCRYFSMMPLLESECELNGKWIYICR